jgi:hypothetical protein
MKHRLIIRKLFDNVKQEYFYQVSHHHQDQDLGVLLETSSAENFLAFLSGLSAFGGYELISGEWNI